MQHTIYKICYIILYSHIFHHVFLFYYFCKQAHLILSYLVLSYSTLPYPTLSYLSFSAVHKYFTNKGEQEDIK